MVEYVNHAGNASTKNYALLYSTSKIIIWSVAYTHATKLAISLLCGCPGNTIEKNTAQIQIEFMVHQQPANVACVFVLNSLVTQHQRISMPEFLGILAQSSKSLLYLASKASHMLILLYKLLRHFRCACHVQL